MIRLASGLLALVLAGVAPAAPTSPVPAPAHANPSEMRPFTAEDLVRIKRVTDPQVSPDGHYVAFVLRETDMEANRGRTDVWLLDLTQKDAVPRRLTQNDADDSSPRWLPTAVRSISFPRDPGSHKCGDCPSPEGRHPA